YVMYALTLSGICGLVSTLGRVVLISLVMRKLRPVLEEEQATGEQQDLLIGVLCTRVCRTQDLQTSGHYRCAMKVVERKRSSICNTTTRPKPISEIVADAVASRPAP